MNLTTLKIEKPEPINFILGQARGSIPSTC
jgi:hypothetical protein